MISPEERRQRILEKSQARLDKLRAINRGESPDDTLPIAPVSTEAPEELLRPSQQEVNATVQPVTPTQPESTSLLSAILSATNFINSFTSSSSTSTVKVENTTEMVTIDKQHAFILIIGILVGLLYLFYIPAYSNLFFVVYFTSCICILTLRYYMMKMKHHTNALITTAMLSGFKPELMKNISLIYTLLYDAWIMFALYFVSFCLTHVICSLF